MPASELNQWREYDLEEPFGQPWDNWLMAIQASMFASVHTGKGKSPPSFESFFFKGKSARAKADESRVTSFIDLLESKKDGN